MDYPTLTALKFLCSKPHVRAHHATWQVTGLVPMQSEPWMLELLRQSYTITRCRLVTCYTSNHRASFQGPIQRGHPMDYSDRRRRPSYPQHKDVRFVEAGPWANARPFQPHPGQSAHDTFTVVVLGVHFFIRALSSSLPAV